MAELATKPKREVVEDGELAQLIDSAVDRSPAMVDEFRKLRLIWNARKGLLRILGVGLLLSVAIAFSIPNRYTSVARLMPPDQNSTGVAMLGAITSGLTGGGRGSGLSSLAGDMLGLKNTGELFVGVLQSNTVEDDVIQKFDLKRRYAIWGTEHIEDARKDLERLCSLSVDRKSGIVTLEITDRDPSRAAAMAKEFVDQLNHVVTHLNTSSAGREREFLEQRLVEVKSDLESAEKGFSEFASKNSALDIPSQGKAMIEAAATLEGQLIASQTELQSLKEIYSDSNIRIRTTQARVEELKRQIQKLGGKNEGVFDASGQVIPSIRQLPLLGVPYADLYRNTKVQEAIYETLIEEFEMAKVQEAKETPNVKILDLPAVPEKKSFPPRALFVLAGTAISVAIGIAFVFLSDWWEKIEPSDTRKTLAREVLEGAKRGVDRASRRSRSDLTDG